MSNFTGNILDSVANSSFAPHIISDTARDIRKKQVKKTVEEKDMELWHAYKRGDKQAQWELLDRFKGAIAKTSMQQSNVLPRPVVEAKLKRYALKAFDTYKPSAGTKLSTHVIKYLKKINRDNYQQQQAIRLPENLAIGYSRYAGAKTQLAESLGRDPNTHELAEHLGWSVDATANAAKKYHKEYVEGKSSFDAGVKDMDVSSSVLRFVYHSLDDKDKYIMEHRSGYLNKPILPPTRIQKDLKMSSYQFYQAQKRIADNLATAARVLEGDS